MESTFEKFLDTIHFDEEKKEKYEKINLKRVTVNNKKNIITIYLSTEEMITLDDYLDLKKKIE